MDSTVTQGFKDRFNALPIAMKDLARQTYWTFKQNPHHPSLNFKKFVTSKNTVYSIRVGIHYRALAYEGGGALV